MVKTQGNETGEELAIWRNIGLGLRLMTRTRGECWWHCRVVK